MDRFDRNERFFGVDGQCLLRESVVAVVGCGGLGTHVIQQLAYLGVRKIIVIDDEDLGLTNKNRYVLAYHSDPDTGFAKVDMIERSVAMIDPTIEVVTVQASVRSLKAFDTMREARTIFGCLDNDGARLILNEYALAYGKELFDLATDTHKDENNFYFGGRLAYVAPDEPNCLVCMDMIDLKAAQEDLASEKSRQDRDSIYGVDRSNLNEIGPSVVSLNGVIASLAVQEYMVQTTGIRKAARQLQYRGNMGIVAVSRPQVCTDCYFCNVVKDSLNHANLERYL